MGTISAYLTLGLVIVCAIIVWVIYHNIFDVYYFGASGCLKEIIICLFGGFVLAAIFIKFWYIGVLILVIAIAIWLYKSNN